MNDVYIYIQYMVSAHERHLYTFYINIIYDLGQITEYLFYLLHILLYLLYNKRKRLWRNMRCCSTQNQLTNCGLRIFIVFLMIDTRMLVRHCWNMSKIETSIYGNFLFLFDVFFFNIFHETHLLCQTDHSDLIYQCFIM
jgi:hypothetical protein